MRHRIRLVAVSIGFIAQLRAAEPASQKDDVVDLPPVVVDESRLNAKVKSSPRWKEELLSPGLIWKLDHQSRTQSFLFDEAHLVRTVFGTKGVMREDGTITAGFRPMRLMWRLEDEWLVFFDQAGRRIEELKFVREGWIWLTAERRSGELLKFKVTKPSPQKPIKIKS